MVRDFEKGRWPKHFNADDKAFWQERARIAKQILGLGAFNPLEHWAIMKIADEELGGETFD